VTEAIKNKGRQRDRKKYTKQRETERYKEIYKTKGDRDRKSKNKVRK
jgi:hypothetical protein